MLAFLYAGQGSQKPQMGKDFYDAFPQVREIFDFTPNVKRLCFDADMAELSKTEHTQPCMGAFAAAVTHLLAERGITPDAAAGLSLGEYGALCAAKVFDWQMLIELLTFRGTAMAAASGGIDCKMSAILTDNASLAEQAVADINGAFVCNYNCPGQTVIGGQRAAVEAAERRAMELGARRCMPLNVSGPFHTPFMRPASEQLAQFMDTLTFSSPALPVVFNVTGGVLQGESVKSLLTRQVMSPVRFEQSLRTLADMGVDRVIEIGPGKVLSGFVKKTIPHVQSLNIDTVDDYRRVAELLGN